MAKPRSKKGKPELPEAVASYVRALQFVSTICEEEHANPSITHCRIGGGQITATDGTLTLSYPIDDNLEACPHALRFLSALLRCDGTVQLTMLPHAISVKAGAFRAAVPKIDPNVLPIYAADPRVMDLPDSLRTALAHVGVLAREGAARAILASVLVREGSCVGTTGTALLEAWHGLSLPTMALPKKSLDALLKVKEPLTGFGYGGSSATFYFESGAWLKTQLMAEQWPLTVDGLLNQPTAAVPMPGDFWNAYDALSDFIDAGSGYVIFGDGHLRSEADTEVGAVYSCAGVGRSDFALDADLLDKCRPHMKTADFVTHSDRVFFFGENVRGIIMHARLVTHNEDYYVAKK